MAIYRIFPSQDATIYSEKPTANSGRDELLEIGGYPTAGTGYSARSLVKFNTDDIQDVIDNKAGGSIASASLHMYLNFASEIPTSFKIESYPLIEQWSEGVGKFGDTPTQTAGCSWTASDSGQNWSTPGGDFLSVYGSTSVTSSQIFDKTKTYDIDMDVTTVVNEWTKDSAPLDNYGLLLKLTNSYENYVSASIRLKYYSSDTNTIYPPFLQLEWDDYSHTTGSLTEISDSDVIVTLRNNKGEYADAGKVRFRLHARPQYPTRTFTTSSAYLTNYYLPTASYWGIRDEFTEEMIVDYDTAFTKISCDATSNYFDVYMDGLQPERFYRFLIKTQIDGSDIVIDNDQIFKITRNG